MPYQEPSAEVLDGEGGSVWFAVEQKIWSPDCQVSQWMLLVHLQRQCQSQKQSLYCLYYSKPHRSAQSVSREYQSIEGTNNQIVAARQNDWCVREVHHWGATTTLTASCTLSERETLFEYRHYLYGSYARGVTAGNIIYISSLQR